MIILRNDNTVPSTRGPFEPFPESFFDDIPLWASLGKFDKILIDVDSTRQYDEDMKVLGSIEKALVRRLRKDVGVLRGAKSRLKMYAGKENFIEKARKVHGNKFNYDNVVYINKETKVEIICNDCGHHFYMTPENHIHGREGCSFCTESRGEGFVRTYLEDNNILYKNKITIYYNDRRFVPDFILENRKVWIEYNGQQHYKPIEVFHESIDTFIHQIKRDCIVRDYCKKNNILLIEIPYTVNTKEKVDIFLDNILKSLSADSVREINRDSSKLYKLDDTGFKIEDLFPT